MIKKQEPLKIAVISDCQVKGGVDLYSKQEAKCYSKYRGLLGLPFFE